MNKICKGQELEECISISIPISTRNNETKNQQVELARSVPSLTVVLRLCCVIQEVGAEEDSQNLPVVEDISIVESVVCYRIPLFSVTMQLKENPQICQNLLLFSFSAFFHTNSWIPISLHFSFTSQKTPIIISDLFGKLNRVFLHFFLILFKKTLEIFRIQQKQVAWTMFTLQFFFSTELTIFFDSQL